MILVVTITGDVNRDCASVRTTIFCLMHFLQPYICVSYFIANISIVNPSAPCCALKLLRYLARIPFK